MNGSGAKNFALKLSLPLSLPVNFCISGRCSSQTSSQLDACLPARRPTLHSSNFQPYVDEKEPGRQRERFQTFDVAEIPQKKERNLGVRSKHRRLHRKYNPRECRVTRQGEHR